MKFTIAGSGRIFIKSISDPCYLDLVATAIGAVFLFNFFVNVVCLFGTKQRYILN